MITTKLDFKILDRFIIVISAIGANWSRNDWEQSSQTILDHVANQDWSPFLKTISAHKAASFTLCSAFLFIQVNVQSSDICNPLFHEAERQARLTFVLTTTLQ